MCSTHDNNNVIICHYVLFPQKMSEPPPPYAPNPSDGKMGQPPPPAGYQPGYPPQPYSQDGAGYSQAAPPYPQGAPGYPQPAPGYPQGAPGYPQGGQGYPQGYPQGGMQPGYPQQPGQGM
ncbi:hypothetical protein NP493_829g01058 [Ridgeia piscesae]|uniref:Uncharacterized protein n=1 Tax=Ridgeia piscesae TaxID=27915 RepID=A0AAD9KMJ8_RIDPI|nr:hypothetical protein NP493_829g01058 [Ridgeia piscesae]